MNTPPEIIVTVLKNNTLTMSTKNDRLTDNPSASYIVHCTLTSSNDLKNINAIALASDSKSSMPPILKKEVLLNFII